MATQATQLRTAIPPAPGAAHPFGTSRLTARARISDRGESSARPRRASARARAAGLGAPGNAAGRLGRDAGRGGLPVPASGIRAGDPTRPLAPPRARGRAAAASTSGVATAADPSRRVVVTGVGLVSAHGCDVDEAYGKLLEGESAVSTIRGFDASALPTRIAAEVGELPEAGRYVNPKWVKRIDPVMKYAIVAGKRALESSGLPWTREGLEEAFEAGRPGGYDPRRCATLVGSAMGGMGTFAASVDALVAGKKMNPFCIPFAIPNAGGAMLAMDLGLMGPCYALSTACATGNYAVLLAARHILDGDCDSALAGGADAAVIPSSIAGFGACKALSTRNDDPAAASRPWDSGRDGFVMGEGAGVLLLERLDKALARSAPIYAEVLGGAFTSDAHHITEPDPEGRGVRRCVELALQRAGVPDPTAVGYVNAHGTSTPAGDVAELRAVRAALPHDSLRINSTKSMLGHGLGAAAAVEAVVTIQALRARRLHPNVNLVNPDPRIADADLATLVGTRAEDAPDLDVALSNSFGFGGHNSSVVFRAWNGE